MDLPAARDYILNRLNHELDKRLVYHSYIHTLDVYHASTELSILEAISEEDQCMIETAALYHDAGMLNGYEDHEESSASMAAEILRKFNYSIHQIEIISELILTTKLPQKASTTLGKILCDADLDYLGRNDFFINSFKLRLEWQLYGIKEYTLPEWFTLQRDFLQNHSYFTRSAKMLRDEGKTRNLQSILALNHLRYK